MAYQCDIRISDQAIRIQSPQGRIIPGRLIRSIVHNLEVKYQLYEFSLIRNAKELQELEDVVDVVNLKRGSKCVIQKLHPSLYDESVIRLTAEELDEFAATVPSDEQMVVADYTVSMPAEYFILVTDNIQCFVAFANHLKLDGFPAMRECAARLGDAAITIFDENDMIIEYQDENLPDILMQDLDPWLKTPLHVKDLDLN